MYSAHQAGSQIILTGGKIESRLASQMSDNQLLLAIGSPSQLSTDRRIWICCYLQADVLPVAYVTLFF